MALKSNSQRYGTVAILIHWISALAILGLFVSGFLASGTTDAGARTALLAAHAATGISILVLTLARILWWFTADLQRPLSPMGTPRWQAISAHAVHGLLYVVILGMAVSGMGMFALSGAADIVFGGTGGTLPNFFDYPPRIPHGIGARLLLLLLAAHIGAALYHQFIRRDGLLARMGAGKR